MFLNVVGDEVFFFSFLHKFLANKFWRSSIIKKSPVCNIWCNNYKNWLMPKELGLFSTEAQLRLFIKYKEKTIIVTVEPSGQKFID